MTLEFIQDRIEVLDEMINVMKRGIEAKAEEVKQGVSPEIEKAIGTLPDLGTGEPWTDEEWKWIQTRDRLQQVLERVESIA
jgi:hypothetical protein